MKTLLYGMGTYQSFGAKKEYKSSKYLNEYSQNSILSPQGTVQDYKNTDYKTIYNSTKAKIKDLYKYFRTYSKDYTDDTAQKITTQILKDDINSNHLKVIVNLIENKKLAPQVLHDLTGEISQNASCDIDRLYGAYDKKRDVMRTFVPEFQNKSQAAENLETGDVCQIKGEENISAKLPDGTIKQFFVTPETYLELFPPVERFVITQSENMGDCYLLASLDSINQNPNTRHLILEMFRENEDGTVDAAFGGFVEDDNGNVIQKDLRKSILKDISKEILKVKNVDITSNTCEGLRALELLHEKERRKIAFHIAKNQDKIYAKLYKNIENGKYLDEYQEFYFEQEGEDVSLLEDKLRENNSILGADDNIYTKKELELYRSYFKTHKPEDIVCIQNMNGVEDGQYITKDQIKRALFKLKDKNDEISVYEKLILDRKLKYMKLCKKDIVPFFECIPKEIYLDIFPDKSEADIFYNHAGYEDSVFEIMGLKDVINVSAKKYFKKNKLFKGDISNCVYTISSDSEHLDAKIPVYQDHSYSMSPIKTKDGMKFAVRNPHNTLNEVILSMDEISEYFDYICKGSLE